MCKPIVLFDLKYVMSCQIILTLVNFAITCNAREIFVILSQILTVIELSVKKALEAFQPLNACKHLTHATEGFFYFDFLQKKCNYNCENCWSFESQHGWTNGATVGNSGHQ